MNAWFELWAYLATSAILSRVCTVDRSLDWVGFIARRLPDAAVADLSHDELERSLMRLSRIVPKANCLDRAMAMRWYAARRSVDGDVVIGFRAEAGGWEGHAWVDWGNGHLSFLQAEDGYRAVLSERRRKG